MGVNFTTNSAKTYVPIATQTLSSTASTITFSSIPSTYTDLRLTYVGVTPSSSWIGLRLNGDTGTNYSGRWMFGSGSTTASQSQQNMTYGYLIGEGLGGSATIPGFASADIFSYAGSTYKTFLVSTANNQNGSGDVDLAVYVWRNTTAVTSLTLITGGTSFSSGTTVTIYGILAA